MIYESELVFVCFLHVCCAKHVEVIIELMICLSYTYVLALLKAHAKT